MRTVTSELLKAVDQLGPGETADTFKQILNNRGSSGGDKKQKQKTMSVSRETTGIFLHTQVSNLPTELVAPLHKNLNDDLTWFNSEASSAGAVCVALSHVLMLTPCARMDLSNSNKKSSNKKDKKDTAACDVTGVCVDLCHMLCVIVYVCHAFVCLVWWYYARGLLCGLCILCRIHFFPHIRPMGGRDLCTGVHC